MKIKLFEYIAAALFSLLLLEGCGTQTSVPEIQDSSVSSEITVDYAASAAPSEESIASDSTDSAEESYEPTDTANEPDTSAETNESHDSSEIPENAALKLLSEMTLEEKVGQLFFVRIEALADEAYGVKALSDDASATLQRYGVGGIALFKENIDTPEQLAALTENLQSESDIPLLIAADEEGGQVLRIGSNPNFDIEWIPSMEEIGATGDPANAAYVGETIAEYLLKYGINTDFAPIADLSSSASGGVIGNRSFGEDPLTASGMLTAEITAMRESGLVTCAKHFPGHGAARDDTHKGYAAVYKTWDELSGYELVPFKAAIEAGTDMIMAAHISLPNVTRDGLPASLSYEIITEKLRGELGWGGVVITDALAMGAVADNYTSSEAAVLAIKAGCDFLLMPENLEEAYNGVLFSVYNGEIEQERLDESVLRILELKESHGLLE